MANGDQCKVVITIDVATGAIDSVKKKIGSTETLVNVGSQPATPPGGFTPCCTVFYYTVNPNCVTINLPGGGSFVVCHPPV
jgi:hypothetical protein